MSQLGGPLVRGVDCPADAEHLDGIATFHLLATPDGLVSDVARARGMATACLFESDAGGSTLWRHTTLLGKQSDGVRDARLVLRHVTTVGNYDYVTEFRFGVDGAIDTHFNFAGFCETRWHDAAVSPEEGPRANGSLSEVVRPHLAAPLHAHFGAFKLDLDVLGEANVFEVMRARVGALDDVAGTDAIATKYLDTAVVPREGARESTRIADARAPALWRVANRRAAAPGAARGASAASRAPGYAIVPTSATVVNTLPADHPFVLPAAFSKYTLAVTRRHDDEPRISSVYDLYAPAEPTVSIDDFLTDGESLEDVDVVAWLSLGKEHIPRTEDMPLISSSMGVSFSLLPWNIFDGHAAMDIPTEPAADCVTEL